MACARRVIHFPLAADGTVRGFFGSYGPPGRPSPAAVARRPGCGVCSGWGEHLMAGLPRGRHIAHMNNARLAWDWDFNQHAVVAPRAAGLAQTLRCPADVLFHAAEVANPRPYSEYYTQELQLWQDVEHRLTAEIEIPRDEQRGGLDLI